MPKRSLTLCYVKKISYCLFYKNYNKSIKNACSSFKNIIQLDVNFRLGSFVTLSLRSLEMPEGLLRGSYRRWCFSSAPNRQYCPAWQSCLDFGFGFLYVVTRPLGLGYLLGNLGNKQLGARALVFPENYIILLFFLTNFQLFALIENDSVSAAQL